MLVLPNKFHFLVLCVFLGIGVPDTGFGFGAGSGSSSGSEREEFLRQFAQDPNAIKTAPTAMPSPAAVETSDDKNPTKNLENLLKNFRKEGVTVRPEKIETKALPGDENAMEEDEGQAQGTIDVSALQKLQGLMGSGSGHVSPEELLKKMQASGMNIPGVPGAAPGESGDYSLIVYRLLHPFRAQSEAEVTLIFQQKMPMLNMIPFANKIPNLIARVARDESALPQVAKIVNQRGKLTQYAIFVFVTFIISFVLKRLKQKQDDSIFSGMKSGLLRSLFMTGLRLAVFFVLFSAELTPLLHVVRNSF
ncbi:MAG: hypothetical protein HYV97_07345 [Bdellovibrio sp.]|nr:hypothetical protein [Bdellovibrio sp.]